MSKRFDSEPSSAPGDFYVEHHCCTSCGVPQMVAPGLVGWNAADDHCCWKKQPETDAEMQQVFAIFDGQELGCHRYAGDDLKIMDRIGYENCDHAAASGQLWIGKATKFSRGFWKRITNKPG